MKKLADADVDIKKLADAVVDEVSGYFGSSDFDSLKAVNGSDGSFDAEEDSLKQELWRICRISISEQFPIFTILNSLALDRWQPLGPS